MDATLVVLVLLVVGGIALGMYMDWFGLWVSKAEMLKEIDQLRASVPGLGEQIVVNPSEAGARAKGKIGAAVADTRI